MSHADEIAQLQKELQQLREKNRDTADHLREKDQELARELGRALASQEGKLAEAHARISRDLGRATAKQDGKLAEAHARIDGLSEDIRDLCKLEDGLDDQQGERIDELRDRLGVLEAWQTSLCEMEELLDVQRDERIRELRDRLDILEEWQRAAIDMFGRRGRRLRKAEGRISHLEQRLELARIPDIIPPEPTPEPTLDGTWAPAPDPEREKHFFYTTTTFFRDILDAAAERLGHFPDDPLKDATLKRLDEIRKHLPTHGGLIVKHVSPDLSSRTSHDEA